MINDSTVTIDSNHHNKIIVTFAYQPSSCLAEYDSSLLVRWSDNDFN